MTKKQHKTRSSARGELLLQRALAWLMAIVLAGLATYGTCWLVWQAALKVSPDIARAAMLLELVALPLAAWAGWYFGRTEARGRLAGIDQAVDKVMGAATRTAGLSVTTTRAMRDSGTVLPTPALPPARVHIRELPAGQTIIDL